MKKQVTVWIDGKQIQTEYGKQMLDVALENGIYIPHLCHHPDLPDIGSCRLCLVQKEGSDDVIPSCTLKAEDGLKIITQSEKIQQYRNLSMELILAAHPEDCSTCPKYGRCELQTLIQYMGVSAMRMRTRTKGFAKNEKNPLYVHDMTRCILCGRCVRACKDLRGVGVLQYNRDDMEIYVGTIKNKLLKDSDCRFCGACAEVCPTGTIRDLINYTPIEKKDELIPCQATCPIHTDIPRYVRLAKEGKFDEATAVIHEKLPFPECLGHVCAHTCEAACRRGDVNEPISIRNIKRYVAEHTDNALWKKNSKQLPDTGKKVCVVGGGPAGMTAAFYLAKQGHEVVLKEANAELGGQMQYGIPSYRLPRETVKKEAAYLEDVGVKIEKNCRVEKPVDLLSQYDAVLMAIGTHQGVRLSMEGNDLEGTLLNADFLKKASMNQETGMGERVVVLGGGNVAFDCARTAVRLGAKEVHLACLEKREAMLADDEEIEQAEEEGIFIYPGRNFEKICGDTSVTGVQFSKIKSFTFDENRRAIIEKEENSEHIVECDTVIFAVGQRTALAEDSGLERGRANSIAVKENSKATNLEGIFACGDAIYGTKTVIQAVASGREAATEIDRYLGGDGDISEVLLPKEDVDPKIGKVENFGYLERAEEQFLGAEERKKDFRPISGGICDQEICKEAGRCLQCDLRFSITAPRVWSNYTDQNEKEAAADVN